MDIFIWIGVIVCVAYLLQTLFGVFQIKHFNTVYTELRKKGRVAIGRRAGKIRAGTLILFAVEEDGKVLDCRLMQGVTVLARFKVCDNLIGFDLHYLDSYHPTVRKYNKLTQLAIMNARELFLRIEADNYVEEPVLSPFYSIPFYLNRLKNRFGHF